MNTKAALTALVLGLGLMAGFAVPSAPAVPLGGTDGAYGAGFAVPSISLSEMYGAGFAVPSAPSVPLGGTDGAYGADQTPAPTSPQARSYDPGGRRDPFKDLFGGKDIRENRTVAGPADLLVEDIVVVGIIKTKSGYRALIAMTDGFPLTAREGDRFADGYILSIGDGTIVFRKTHERGVPLPKPKDIVRDITSEER
jgi:hypothetical protein